MKTNLKIIGLVLVVMSLFACKKEYTCVCQDSRADIVGVKIKDTYRNAKRIYENNPINANCKLIK